MPCVTGGVWRMCEGQGELKEMLCDMPRGMISGGL